MSLENSKKLSRGSIKVDIDAVVNKKAQAAQLFVQFNTKETGLLSQLLQKYVSEKCGHGGMNINNFIYTAVAGEDSILLTVPENKLFNNIVLLWSYLAKTELKGKQRDQCAHGDYEKLMNDIKEFKVKVAGKCKLFCAHLDNKAKTDNMMETLSSIEPKKRDSITSSKFEEIKEKMVIDSADKDVALYLSALFGHHAISISQSSGKTIVGFLNREALGFATDFVLKKESIIVRTQAKSLLSASGNVGSPSAKDTGGKKFNEKCEQILASENQIAGIHAALRGFTYSFKSVENVKQVNGEAVSAIMRGKLEF